MGPVREMLAESGINEQKWRVLRVLDERGAMDISAVAEAACLLLPSLTRIVRAMEAEGLITRSEDPGDRRKSILAVAEAGRRIIEAHAVDSNALFARLESAYGKEKLETLLDLLDDLRRTDFDRAGRG